MDTYSILRQMADSWVLLALFLIFVGIIGFAFRPGSKAIYRNVADIPLRNGDDLEADQAPAARPLPKETRQ